MAFVEGSYEGKLNGPTSVVIAPAPPTGARRLIRTLSIFNPMSTGVALSVVFVSGVIKSFLFSGVLQRRSGWAWGYQGVLVLDSPGKHIEAWMENAPPIDPTFVTAWGDAS